VSGPGTVEAVYRRAAYLRLPGGIVGVVAPDVPLGPLWIQGHLTMGTLRPGDPATAGDGWLDVAGSRVPTGEAPTWRGSLPDRARLGAVLLFALDVIAAGPPSALLDDPWRPALRRAEAALGRADLAGTAAALGGLGPGLTPAGDDALAGILLARRALAGANAEPELLAVARSVNTTELSGALLAWAARGQAVEPVHGLLGALAAGDRPAAAAAVERVAALGASSGADLLLGLKLGLGLATLSAPAPPADHPAG
jgi:uncharacterized protein DUF2877